jgi:hypothetical protein
LRSVSNTSSLLRENCPLLEQFFSSWSEADPAVFASRLCTRIGGRAAR